MEQKIERIPLKNIVVGEYQREPSVRRVERIVTGFDDANCLVLEGLTLRQEADYYRKQNENHVNLNNFDLYLTGIISVIQIYFMTATAAFTSSLTQTDMVK